MPLPLGRSFVLAAFALFVVNASVFFLACGDDAATPTGDGGTAEGGGGSSGSSGASSGGAEDAGPDAKRTKDGCLLFTTGHKSGKKAESTSGGVAWQTPEGALSEDDKAATITLDDNQESATLKVSDFGLALPDGAETWGIVVELKRQTQTDGGILQSANVDVEIEGKPSRYTFDNDKLFWPRSIIGRHGYGQELDTWGVDLYPEDVEKASFAAKLRAQKGKDGGAPGPITGIVDSLKVAVWYASGPPATCQR